MIAKRISIPLAGASLVLFAAGFAGGVALVPTPAEPTSTELAPPLEGGSPVGVGRGRGVPGGGRSLTFLQPEEPVSLSAAVEELGGVANLRQRRRMLARITLAATAAECRDLIHQFRGDDLAVAQVAARWAEIDPAGLFAFLGGAGKTDFAGSDAVVSALFNAWVRSDPEGAFAAVQGVGSFNLRNRYVTELVGNLLLADPAAAIAMVNRSIAAGEEVLGHYGKYGAWADADRPGAAELILSLPRCKFRLRLASDLCQRWATVDPQAAVEFAEKLDSQARASGIENAFIGWLDYDFEAARQYIEAAPGSTRARLGGRLVGRMAAADPDRAFAWIDQHLEGASRRRAIEAAVQAGADLNPGAVARHVQELPVGNLKRSVVQSTARAWFESDPGGAAGWLQDLGPGFALQAGLEGLRRARLPEAQRAALELQVRGEPVAPE